MACTQKFKLIYLNAMGIAEPIRLLFALAEVDYVDERIDMDDWPNQKSKMPWGTVPVLIEDGKELCQSLTILRHLGKKFCRGGSTDFENAKCDEYVDAMNDVVRECIKQFFEPDAAKKEELGKKLKDEIFPKLLKKLSSILEEQGTGLLVGKDITYADLYVAHMLNRNSQTASFEEYPLLLKHREIVFNNPNIKRYVEKRPVTQM